MVVEKVKSFLVYCLFLFVITGCTGDTIFDQHIDFPDQTWSQDEPGSFTFMIEEADKPYAIRLYLRNAMNYPMQNLFVQWSLKDSLGVILHDDLVNIQLFEEKTGRPLNKGLSNMATQEIMLDSAFIFPHAGRFELVAEQYMRVEKLIGVMSIGLRIEKPE